MARVDPDRANSFCNPASGDYWGYGNYWEDAIYVALVRLSWRWWHP